MRKIKNPPPAIITITITTIMIKIVGNSAPGSESGSGDCVGCVGSDRDGGGDRDGGDRDGGDRDGGDRDGGGGGGGGGDGAVSCPSATVSPASSCL